VPDTAATGALADTICTLKLRNKERLDGTCHNVGKTGAAIAPIAERRPESILWSPIGGVCYGTPS
jgi:hypothetical protein